MHGFIGCLHAQPQEQRTAHVHSVSCGRHDCRQPSAISDKRPLDGNAPVTEIMPWLRESNLRKLARRKGYCLRTSKAPIGKENGGGYKLVALNRDVFVVAGDAYTLTPLAVWRYLTD